MLSWFKAQARTKFTPLLLVIHLNMMNREATTMAAVSSMGENRLYAIKSIPTKGYGMVAVASIPKGTRILSEAPLFTFQNGPDIRQVERVIVEQIRLLSKEQQRAFFALHNAHPGRHSPFLGIARTNVLPLGPNSRGRGLFLEASRINHACRNNAQNTWNENIKEITIHAVRDIEESEEITIVYSRAFEAYAERQRFLQDKFSFTCECELCSLPLAKREESDLRLRELKSLDEFIGQLQWGKFNPQLVLQLVYNMIRLFEAEDIWDIRLARPYNDAFEAAIENGDETRAKVFGERAYAVRKTVEGDDSASTIKMKGFAEQPAKSPLYRESTESSQDRGPPQSESEEFDDWLWMKHDLPKSEDTPDNDDLDQETQWDSRVGEWREEADYELDAWSSIFQSSMARETKEEDEKSFDSLSTTAIHDAVLGSLTAQHRLGEALVTSYESE
ncbi:SET domain-containing protein [Hypoxylon sp. FL0890]|nr:SET domain-containing protein [Hypoxylon sp. FL0890]